MATIYIRKAQLTDLSVIMKIIDAAKLLLKQDGSPQWQDGQPSQDTFKQDIKNGNCYLLIFNDQIAGTATLLQENDPHYAKIDGNWAANVPYATIHRIALSSDFRGQHLSDFFMSNLISLAYSEGFWDIRIDTHQLNKRMQHLITQQGFEYRGVISVAPGENGLRRAYELQLR